jgi:tetratricopeptide (TPR) repeat protein
MGKKQLSPDKAEAMWREAVDLYNSDNNGKHKKAIKLASRLIEEGPNTPDTLSRMKCFIADVYSQKLGEHDKAIEYYKEALEDDPNNSLAGSNLGSVYLVYKKDYEAAEQILQQTLARGISSVFVRESTKDWLEDAKRKLGR